MPSERTITIVADADALARAAADELARLAERAVGEAGIFTVALAGGSTPKRLYSLLADEKPGSFRDQLPWDSIHVFWGDERLVSPDHPDSNYRMARDVMLANVPIPPGNVHRVRSEKASAAEVAAEYEHTLRQFVPASGDGWPRFDLILLGMGSDGHTASLFPGSEALGERTRMVVAPWVAKLNAYRITLTPPVLNNAAAVVFLVSGADKAETLRQVLEGEREPVRLPAQIVQPTNGALVWLVDRDAAGRLRG